jgi:hypothetical protein
MPYKPHPFSGTNRNQPGLARDTGIVPVELFELYALMGYLSFGSAPNFLRDDRNIIFSYFSMLLNCLLDNLTDARQQSIALETNHALLYDFGKRIRHEYWDPQADGRFRRNLRDILIALDGTLDTAADLVALMLAGRWKISQLTLGKGDFVSIYKWLAREFEAPVGTSTGFELHARNLYDQLRPLVVRDPPEQDWLGLTHLLRNKILHFGQGMLRQVGLHDTTPRFYLFIPRQWPFIYERYLRPRDPNVPHDPNLMRELFTGSLIHQDVLTFTRGLELRVGSIVAAVTAWTATVCADCAGMSVSPECLAALESPLASSSFEYFVS